VDRTQAFTINGTTLARRVRCQETIRAVGSATTKQRTIDYHRETGRMTSASEIELRKRRSFTRVYIIRRVLTDGTGFWVDTRGTQSWRREREGARRSR